MSLLSYGSMICYGLWIQQASANLQQVRAVERMYRNFTPAFLSFFLRGHPVARYYIRKTRRGVHADAAACFGGRCMAFVRTLRRVFE